MGNIYLFKMLIPLIETHVFLLNRKTKVVFQYLPPKAKALGRTPPLKKGKANTFTAPFKITFVAIMSELIDIHPHLYYLVFFCWE